MMKLPIQAQPVTRKVSTAKILDSMLVQPREKCVEGSLVCDVVLDCRVDFYQEPIMATADL